MEVSGVGELGDGLALGLVDDFTLERASGGGVLVLAEGATGVVGARNFAVGDVVDGGGHYFIWVIKLLSSLRGACPQAHKPVGSHTDQVERAGQLEHALHLVGLLVGVGAKSHLLHGVSRNVLLQQGDVSQRVAHHHERALSRWLFKDVQAGHRRLLRRGQRLANAVEQHPEVRDVKHLHEAARIAADQKLVV